MILSYVLTQEAKSQNERTEIDFQNQLFLHALGSQNRDLYFRLYPVEEQQDDGQQLPPEEWEVPRSPEELQSMLAEFNVGRIA